MEVKKSLRTLVDLIDVEGTMILRIGADQGPPPLCLRENPDNPGGGPGLVVDGGTIHRRITPDFWLDLDRALGKVEPPMAEAVNKYTADELKVAQQNYDSVCAERDKYKQEAMDLRLEMQMKNRWLERLTKCLGNIKEV